MPPRVTLLTNKSWTRGMVQRVDLSDGSSVTEKNVTNGIKLRQQWQIDEGCSVWKGKKIACLADLAVSQVIQANLTWVSLLKNQNAICKEMRIDDPPRGHFGIEIRAIC